MEAGSESPWFPGYRIYRERYGAGWDEAFSALAADLRSGSVQVPVEDAAAMAEKAFRNGVDAYAAGDIVSATASFRECVRLQPDHVKGTQNLGVVLSGQGDQAGAEFYLWKAFELEPSVENGTNLALVLEQTNRLAEAAKIYEFLLRQSPTNAPTHYRLGEVKKGLGDAAASRQHFGQALELQPTNLDYALSYALASWDEEPAETVRVCERFLAMSMDDTQRVRLLKTYLVHKEWHERMLRGEAPYHAASLDELFFRYAATAFEDFRRVTKSEAERHPQDVIAVQNHAIALFCAGDRKGTEACLKRFRTAVSGHVWENVTFDPAFYRSLEKFSEEDLIKGLPPLLSVRHADFRGQPAIYLSCDGAYFDSFAIPLIRSMADKGDTVCVHAHIMDATSTQLDRARALGDELGNLALAVTAEAPGIGAQGIMAARCYFHAIRFIRYFQLLKTVGSPLWLMDVDALFRHSPTEMYEAIGAADVAMRIRPGRLEPWNQFNACVVGGKSTPASIEYFRLIAAYIAHFHQRGNLRWGIDQTAMYGVFTFLQGERRAPSLALIDDHVLDYDHRESGIVWPNSGTKKFLQLVQRSPDGTVAADEAGQTEYVHLFNRYAHPTT
jgi:tetratricopeptide (TPR) repeat protein